MMCYNLVDLTNTEFIVEAIINKKAGFNYHLEEKTQAGIVLEGWEVKPILNRQMSLDGSHVIIKDGELFLLNSKVIPEKTTSTHVTAVSDRTRKLLMKKKEIMRLVGQVQEKGYTLVVTKVFKNGRNIKVEIALAKGKKLFDKREDEKEKDWKREQERLMKNKT